MARRRCKWLSFFWSTVMLQLVMLSHITGDNFKLQVLCALSFLATGSYQRIVGVSHHLPQRTVSRIIKQVVEALNHSAIMAKWIIFPKTRHDRGIIKQKFQRKFRLPGVIGCIDCTHVAIVKPNEQEHLYFNRKGYHSLNVQMICDSELRITNVNAKFGGATHDSHIWSSSRVESYMRELHQNNEQVWLLGDSGYPQRPWLMTPILNAVQGSREEEYTQRHVQARIPIERCFALLKARWRCLLKDRALHYQPYVASNIIMACCVLHNIALKAGLPPPPPVLTMDEDDSEPGEYAWTSWGTWGPCSRSCGGGVSVQKRQCLPRSRGDQNSTLPPLPKPVITVRVTRQITSGDCPGVARRYHQCNTKPCPGVASDSRADQCAMYDRRPFRGRFYTWVPYIDGNSPCTLNCRPLGQQFYASLALAADGTPCTHPGFRAICVQGTCKVVGRESVLSLATDRDLVCGNRLVSGLFTRPKLPLGYSYVTTVPRGACRINVSEGIPSENFIALKITNKTYIFNGEFAISSAGTYEAVGTLFYYARFAGQDSVYAAGPLQEPIDIMILYTQAGSNIKYEYLTEAPDDIDNDSIIQANTSATSDFASSSTVHHGKRHHVTETFPKLNVPKIPYFSVAENSEDVTEDQFNIVGSRRFKWKIISYSSCTRTCGGGIQIGKYRCVEETKGTEWVKGLDKEVSPIHCAGAPPPVGRRRRCGNIPCPPRWRTAVWSTCPKCGPAQRNRIVGCVQDHARGIIKVNDQKCPPPKPATVEVCDIPNCDDAAGAERDPQSRERVDSFRDGPVYTIALNNSSERGPSYSFSAAATWLFTEWSECVGWCIGGGTQTRGVRCTHPAGCSPLKPPATERGCDLSGDCQPYSGMWFVGDWSTCSAQCGGMQVRGVLCVGGTGRHLRDSACTAPRPETRRTCGDNCTATWYFSDWGKCISNCTSPAPTGVQRRTVVCSTNKSGNDDLHCLASTKPNVERSCEPKCHVFRTKPSTEEFTDLRKEQTNVIFSTALNTSGSATENEMFSDCGDKLNNCALAVQARLCHYNFYIKNCCKSCKGR